MRGSKLGRWTLMAGAALVGLTSGPAFAQTADTEIVVTGTRIASGAANAPQPIQVLTAAQVAQRGDTSIVDALERIPALQASNSVDQSVRDSAVTGRTSLNLRGLGVNRTLVLVNGRRHVAGSPGTAAVDTSSIPSGLIERVDVLTGGASAIYGSDAVTGVVNFILKDDFEGQQFDMQFDLSEEGDAPALYGSYIGGKNFANGKGNITLGVQLDTRKGILVGDREQFAGNKLPLTDDVTNPALSFQNGDPLPTGVSAIQAVGLSILRANGTPRFANTAQSLIDRARSASPQFIGQRGVFAISANQGLLALSPYGGLFAEGSSGLLAPNDVNNNGINDCDESEVGRGRLAGFTAGCWVVDRTTGALRPFRDGLIADGTYQFGGDGAEQGTDGDSLTPDTSSIAVNLTGNYKFNKNFRVYTELKATENRAKELNFYNTFDDTIVVGLDNPFIPTALRNLANQEIAAQLAADPTYDPSLFTIALARDHIDIFDPRLRNTRRSYRAVVGFDGELGAGWKYDFSVNYGRSEQQVFGAARLRDRFFAAADVTVDSQGRPACRITVDGTEPLASGLDPDAFSPVSAVTFSPADCRPLNLFGLNKSSPEALAFQRYIAKSDATIEQTVIQGYVTGDTRSFFSLQGGPIGIAAGGEYREEKSDFQPDTVNLNGLAFEQRRVAAVKGQFDVSEAFVEVSLPLLADLPFAHALTLNGAYRVGDYSTVGDTSSYKVDGVYAPVPDFRIRGGFSQTVRAPNIVELFRGGEAFNTNPRDPCLPGNIGLGPSPANRQANCLAVFGSTLGNLQRRTAQFGGTRLGNPNLQEETSDSWTAGIVFQPRFLSGFSATIDYWNIKIENAISTPDTSDVVANCYDAATLNNAFCAQFGRNLSVPITDPGYGVINSFTLRDLNFAAVEAAGVDFNLSYALPLEAIGAPKAGDITLRVAGTYLEKNNDFPFLAEPNRIDPAKLELDFPEWSYTASAIWDINQFSIGWFASYQSEQALRSVEIETIRDWTPNTAPSSWVHDLSVTWTPKETFQMIAGVNDVFEEDPYFTETSIPVSPVGRSFFVRLSSQF